MDKDAAFERYLEGQDAYGRGDLDGTLAAWQQVLDFFDEEKLDSLEGGYASIPRTMLVHNLAGVSQAAERWADMRRYAEILVADARKADNLQLLATALKNDGDPDEARKAIEEAVRLDPHFAHGHHEHACILAAAGELDAALRAMEAAIAAGSTPQSLLDDDELAMMKDVPGFARVMGTERHVEAALARLADLSATLDGLRGQSDLPSDVEIAHFEEALAVTRRILDASFGSGAPRDARGRIILGECTALQRSVIEDLLGHAALWRAIPFLNLIGEIGIPNTTVQDARRELLADPSAQALDSLDFD